MNGVGQGGDLRSTGVYNVPFEIETESKSRNVPNAGSEKGKIEFQTI